MKNVPSRSLMFRIHFVVNVFCFLVTLVTKVFAHVSFGIFTMLALILPVVGIMSFFMNNNKNWKKELYLLGSLLSCISLLLVSQNIFRTAIRLRFGFFWTGFYFLLTTIIIVGIIYLVLLDKSSRLFRTLAPKNFLLLWITLISISVLIYRNIFVRFLHVNELLFISYTLWVVNITLTIITCFDLRVSLFKGR